MDLVTKVAELIEAGWCKVVNIVGDDITKLIEVKS